MLKYMSGMLKGKPSVGIVYRSLDGLAAVYIQASSWRDITSLSLVKK